jgi:hypothetical protein
MRATLVQVHAVIYPELVVAMRGLLQDRFSGDKFHGDYLFFYFSWFPFLNPKRCCIFVA